MFYPIGCLSFFAFMGDTYVIVFSLIIIAMVKSLRGMVMEKATIPLGGINLSGHDLWNR